MPIPFAPGTRIRTVFTGDSKSAIIDAVRTALLAAGWTVVGGSGDEKYDCVTTAQGLQCRARVWDGATNCATVRFTNVTETAVGSDHFLLPKASPAEYCVIANQHQFCVLVINQASQPRTFVMGGVPFLDPPLYTPVKFITEAIWSQGNGISDTDAVGALSFRSVQYSHKGWTDTNGIYTNSYSTTSQASSNIDRMTLLVKLGLIRTDQFDNTGYLHHNGQSNKVPARILWGRSANVYRRIMGTLWDAVVINSPPAAPILGDSLHAFDDYRWHCVTDPAVVATDICVAEGCLFLAYEAL